MFAARLSFHVETGAPLETNERDGDATALCDSRAVQVKTSSGSLFHL